mmetsp:Transcript_3479/g.5334  ORF Transcript_3479/g.5334 Transcript_3479/m.5334 type:complete len:445 (-) Transcript_3479:133-1467(-)|eukprot:CAMPEP_0195293186 /NCGR_PEP_ID=MMETSP0707-20130614/11936_1 /TAXON_ID=33640 /ORGANISM="Asterionellopsis glacialis, Strain CCMP134" /LENGTH=444 /DNA_ID=CAMNT_0040353843 /DNA_START=212 /DNA_END=1546 /DNA_ORIENTATION=+
MSDLTKVNASVRKHASLRRSTQLAQESNHRRKSKTIPEFVKRSRAQIEFEMRTLQAELNLLDELSTMTDDEKLHTLFALLDKNGDQYIDANEFADGIRKVRGDVDFEEGLALSIDRISTFDKNEEGTLNFEEFENAIHTLSNELGCTFHDLSEMLVVQVVFSKTGNSRLENMAGEMALEEITKSVLAEEEYRKALRDKRMKALFGMFDINGDGEIDFKEVVIGMYKLTEDIEGSSKLALNALLMYDDNNSRTLDYKQFAKLILNVVSASPDHVKFDDVADIMTRLACDPVQISSEELSQLSSIDKSLQTTEDVQEAYDDDVGILNTELYQRVNKLFDIFDVDHDGGIDFHEFALGLRKFEETTNLNRTVEETIAVMNEFDKDSKNKLNRKEFIAFLTKFAKTAEVNLSDLVDFMVVKSTLRENTDEEKDYLNAISASDAYYWGL